jgi:hypothetical protein
MQQASKIITDFKYKSYTIAHSILIDFENAIQQFINVCLYFLLARVCFPLLYNCRPFCSFERCLDSNPESFRSKQACYQLSHPSPPRNKNKCILHLQLLKCCYPFFVYACKYARTYTAWTYICIYSIQWSIRLVASGWGVNTVNTYLICQIRGPWAQGHLQSPRKGGWSRNHPCVCPFLIRKSFFCALVPKNAPESSSPPPPENCSSGVALSARFAPGCGFSLLIKSLLTFKGFNADSSFTVLHMWNAAVKNLCCVHVISNAHLGTKKRSIFWWIQNCYWECLFGLFREHFYQRNESKTLRYVYLFCEE